jgi:hypothetical protein
LDTADIHVDIERATVLDGDRHRWESVQLVAVRRDMSAFNPRLMCAG